MSLNSSIRSRVALVHGAIHRGALALGLVVLVIGIAVGERHARAATDSTAFCGQRVVRDYLAPLRRMPGLHQIPASGRLPFAPKGVSLIVLGDGLRVGKDLVGFRFSDEGIDVRRRLNWTVESAMAPVGSRGQLLSSPRSKTIHYGTELVDDIGGPRFRVPSRPAFYRFDLVFRNGEGRELGRYGAYFRVVRAQLKSRVALSASVAAPGETLLARVENLGTEVALSDTVFRVERAEEAGWSEVAKLVVPGLRPGIRSILSGGEASRCVSYKIPLDAAPGMYRVSNRISPYRGESQGTLFEEFRVG
jgi:hypothetical protein